MNLLLRLFAVLFCLCLTARAHTAAEEMAGAANNFLATLTPEQKTKATFDFKGDERANWHYIPKLRKGLTFKEMTPVQNRLANALLATGLSQRGFAQTSTIMSLEQILREMEGPKGAMVRDEELYYVSIFGTPGAKEPWGWRVEGHHLSLNFTVIKSNEITATPFFVGTNPGEVRQGPRKGLRVLAAEEDQARALVKSLTDEQKKTAIYADDAPKEVLTAAQRRVKPLPTAGLSAAKMTKEQNDALLKLVKEYVQRCRPELADSDLEKIQKAGWDKVVFAWAGGIEKGEGHYYMVQGPTFLLEYDNTQNNNNHVHAVWRDFANDFGEDLLKKHYAETPHP
jgi:hypothetical protein